MIQIALISINIDEASMADVVVKAAGSKIKQVLIPAVKEQCRALEELLAKKYSHTQSNYCKLALNALTLRKHCPVKNQVYSGIQNSLQSYFKTLTVTLHSNQWRHTQIKQVSVLTYTILR